MAEVRDLKQINKHYLLYLIISVKNLSSVSAVCMLLCILCVAHFVSMMHNRKYYVCKCMLGVILIYLLDRSY